MNVALLRANSQQSRAYKPRQTHRQEVFSANFHNLFYYSIIEVANI